VILDFSSRPHEAHLYEVLDAETGEPIDESISYADDEAGFYRRRVHLSDDVCYTDPAAVFRPIRIVPRLERLCASLRASLAEQGVSADAIPEPVLGALALFQERLDRLEDLLLSQQMRADILQSRLDHPRSSVESVTTAERAGNPDGRYPTCMPRIGDATTCERCGGHVDLAINRPCPAVPREQRWGPSVESVTRPSAGPTSEQVDAWLEIVTRAGRPWTHADLERFLPEVRLESVTTPEAPGAAREYLAGVSATARGIPSVPHDSDLD
jgi:hypothetical protein